MSTLIIDRDVGVEMRDGVELATDIYRPREEGSYPTLVQRTSYDKSDAQVVGGFMFNPLKAVERGYTVVVQDVRGRYESEGEWDPMRNESEDGYDTVEWAAEQPWSDGNVGIYGPSYMGLTTWQAVVADPPHLEAAFPYVTGSDYHEGWAYTGGAFELGFNAWWITFLLGFDTANRIPKDQSKTAKRALATMSFDLEEGMNHLPVADLPAFDNEAAAYWREWLNHPTDDEYWEEIDVTARAADITTPVLHTTGWYDMFLRGHLDAYHAIREEAPAEASESQHFIVGPWSHDQYMSEAITMVGDKELGVKAPAGPPFVSDIAFQWFDAHLKDEPSAIEDLPRVQYFQFGDDQWQTVDEWPPEHDTVEFYLHSDGDANTRFGDGRLTREQPDKETADSYDYDPADPVPTVGGRTTMPNVDDAGVKDQSEIEEREDVLVYTSPKRTTPLRLAGPLSVRLYAASSTPDTDFTAKLVDVHPDGYAGIVAEGIQRARYRESKTEATFLEPGDVYTFDIDLWSTAYTFEPGHRVRLEISSSNFPRFDRNLNVEKPVAQADADDMQVATQQIFHEITHPSHVSLPVVDE